MIVEYEPHSVRHIVVILNATESGRSALDTAVRFAAVLGAELEGVFVEDINLVRMAGLPFLRELRPWPLSEQSFSVQRIESELHALARRAEKSLAQAASELGVNWSFRVWQGRAEVESLIASFEADILTLARVSSLMSYRPQALLQSRRKPVYQSAFAINVLMRDSAQSIRALSVACRLAGELNARLSIWLAPDERDDVEGLRDKANAILTAHKRQARVDQLADSEIETFTQSAKLASGSVLITEAQHPLLKNGLSQYMESLSCPLLLVR